jgi:hypothetical protein
MLTALELEELTSRLHQVVCTICTDRKSDGSCGLTEMEQCPIWMHLPRLVEITNSVKSNRMEDYSRKLREEVCSVCRSAQLPRGECDVRDEGHCALDAYLLVIIQTIEDFLAEKSRAGTLPV